MENKVIFGMAYLRPDGKLDQTCFCPDELHGELMDEGVDRKEFIKKCEVGEYCHIKEKNILFWRIQ